MSEEVETGEEEYKPEYMCIKLSSGDIVMGELCEWTDKEISLHGVLSVTVESGNLVASPYCKFTEGDIFSFNTDHIVFVKWVHPKIVPNYIRLAKRMELAYASVEDKLMPDEDSEMEEYLDELEKLIKPHEDFVPNTAVVEAGKKSFIKGNDTKH